ncbi:cytochrome P450 [Streptomyces kaniharaensis]|uniref:Cytochrome P450 n=1 Tax=Streptomyces kaniharaensis TaxID=212423 RepID=A0A6N7L1J7_9ACTN|nr:cytochrome P450 [Streptomyces kaniharaensis]MQS17025.1 cytochrome P450 [Streptomyces kaniharaensis]
MTETTADPTDSTDPTDTVDLPGLPRERGCPFDPAPGYAHLRESAPITRIAFPSGGSGWLVTRYEDVRALLADPRFSSRLSAAAPHVRTAVAALPEPLPGALLRLDEPEHARYRRPVMRAFTVKRVQQLRPRIQQIVDERLDAMERAGGPVDLVAELALPVTSLVICELLGVSYDDRETFHGLAGRLLAIESSPEEGQQARAELASFIAALVAAKREKPDDDLLSTLIAEADADPDSPLTDIALTVLGSLLLIAGHETTANMIALGTLTLLEHPDQLAALREDPALADRTVEELLRHLTIIQFGLVRMATEDLTLGGRSIRAGEYVVASLPSANRDPGLGIEDPDRLDITRTPAAHVAFGYGPHQCLGQQLARAELQITLTSLFSRFPGLRLAAPAESLPFRDDMLIYGLHQLPVTW